MVAPARSARTTRSRRTARTASDHTDTAGPSPARADPRARSPQPHRPMPAGWQSPQTAHRGSARRTAGTPGVGAPLGSSSLCARGQRDLGVRLHPTSRARSAAEVALRATLRAILDPHLDPQGRAVCVVTARRDPLLHLPAALVAHPPLIPLSHQSPLS